MPRFHFAAHLRTHLDCPAQDVAAATLREALELVFAYNPRLRGYLLDDQGRLRKHVNIFIDGESIGDRDNLSDPVAEAKEVYVLQALSGG